MGSGRARRLWLNDGMNGGAWVPREGSRSKVFAFSRWRSICFASESVSSQTKGSASSSHSPEGVFADRPCQKPGLAPFGACFCYYLLERTWGCGPCAGSSDGTEWQLD